MNSDTIRDRDASKRDSEQKCERARSDTEMQLDGVKDRDLLGHNKRNFIERDQKRRRTRSDAVRDNVRRDQRYFRTRSETLSDAIRDTIGCDQERQ